MDIVFDINTLLTILKDYGLFAAVFAFFGMMFVKYVLGNFNRWRHAKIEPPVKSKGEILLPIEVILPTPTEGSSLIRDAFFAKTQHRIMVEIPMLDLIPHKPVRERLFKDLLVVAFQTIHNAMLEFVSNESLPTWSTEEWQEKAAMAVTAIIVSTEDSARRIQIPELAIRKFLKWHTLHVDQIHDYIRQLGNSKLHDTPMAKTSILLLIMDLLLVSVLGDGERVIDEISGDLLGLSYRGLPIE